MSIGQGQPRLRTTRCAVSIDHGSSVSSHSELPTPCWASLVAYGPLARAGGEAFGVRTTPVSYTHLTLPTILLV